MARHTSRESLSSEWVLSQTKGGLPGQARGFAATQSAHAGEVFFNSGAFTGSGGSDLQLPPGGLNV